jgi:hypothetical protein
MRAGIPASSRLFAMNREIFVCVRQRGGVGRTRTSNQAVIVKGWRCRAQAFCQLRPSPPARHVTHRNGDRLLLSNQHDQLLASGDAGVEKIPLQHGVVLREHRDYIRRCFATLVVTSSPTTATIRARSTRISGTRTSRTRRDILHSRRIGLRTSGRIKPEQNE